MSAAGTSDESARDAIRTVAGDWLAPPRRGAVAFAAGEPDAAAAVRELVADGATSIVVAQYLLAPGVLPDRAVAAARGAADALGVPVVVGDVIGDAPELLDLVPSRARDAAASAGHA